MNIYNLCYLCIRTLKYHKAKLPINTTAPQNIISSVNVYCYSKANGFDLDMHGWHRRKFPRQRHQRWHSYTGQSTELAGSETSLVLLCSEYAPQQCCPLVDNYTFFIITSVVAEVVVQHWAIASSKASIYIHLRTWSPLHLIISDWIG